MKTCFKCKRALSLSEFYKHEAMADGLLGKCKDCTRSDVRSNRANRVEYYRAYDRERSKTPEVMARIAAVSRAWAERNQPWRKAQMAVSNAVRDGLLIRPTRCSRCRETGRIQAHHWDYSRPLVVEWLCKPCHHRADAERRAA